MEKLKCYSPPQTTTKTNKKKFAIFEDGRMNYNGEGESSAFFLLAMSKHFMSPYYPPNEIPGKMEDDG